MSPDIFHDKCNICQIEILQRDSRSNSSQTHLLQSSDELFSGNYLKQFEQTVISNGVDWLKDQFLAMAREFRQLQTGKVQEYTLVSMLIAIALAFVVLAINFGWLNQLFTIIP